MESFGEVSGTYVARKRDKGGCRFGFASFKGVRDKGELEKALRGVRMGEYKLKVNVAKFAVENSVSNACPEGGGQVPKYPVPGVKVRGSGSQGVPREEGVEKTIVVPDRLVAFDVLRGRAVVGRTVDLETLVDFAKLLRIAKISVENIQYLGGLSILISFGDNAGASAFLNARKVWEPWFSKVEIWGGQGGFGKVLHVMKSLVEEKDLSLSRVAVLAGEASRIREKMKLVWKDRVFRVWVEEELEDWVPDCLGGHRAEYSPGVSLDAESPVDCNGGSSPLASSPVVGFSGLGNRGGGEEVPEGSCMGGGEAFNEKSADVGSEGVRDLRNVFNYDSFLGNEMGSTSVPSRNKKGMFVFMSGKKSKRLRKGGNNYQGSPVNFVDSGEKARPIKRSRAQIEEDSDPFSLDKFLDPKLFRDNSEVGDQASSGGGGKEIPCSGEGRCFDLNRSMVPESSVPSTGQGGGDKGDGGDKDFEAWISEVRRI
ncbi:hypothetical protein Hanom_Chr16g01497761 [Helianthus anomalus]